jgi:hypothetical protein
MYDESTLVMKSFPECKAFLAHRRGWQLLGFNLNMIRRVAGLKTLCILARAI